MKNAEGPKVYFEVDSNEWHGHSSESLWAVPMHDGFELQNVPFFAKDISLGDVVEGRRDSQGNICFAGVLKRGGHSTVRIVGPSAKFDRPSFKAAIEKLVALGCEYESGTVQDLSVYAIDIPPTSDIGDVYRLLESEREEGIWDWELGFDGHPPDEDE